MSVGNQESWKNLFLLKYENLDDSELKKIIYLGKQKIMALPTTLPPGEMESKCDEILGESKACAEILEKRQKEEKKLQDAIENWRVQDKKKTREVLSTMEYGTSANGQLVAAILEEEGDMTSDEIAGWCDELSALDEEEFNSLIGGLVDEHILSCNDGKYHLDSLCTPDLYPQQPVEEAMKVLKESGETKLGLCRLMLTIMLTEGRPVDTAAIVELRDGFRFLSGNNEIAEADFKVPEVRIQTTFMDMATKYKVINYVYMGVEPKVRRDSFYYFKKLK